MRSVVRWVGRLVDAARVWWSPEPPPVTIEVVEDEPEAVASGVLYVVGGEDPVYAVMVCPCGCEAPLRMNVRPEAHPRWSWAADADGAATLRPSVWRSVGCRSHFFLRHGLIEWCAP